MFAIFASIRIKPDQLDSFLATIKDTVACSVRDEPGCLRFDVFRDDANENRYLLYEVYTDEAAFDDHLKTPHARLAMEGSKYWGDAPFEVIRASSIFPNDHVSFRTFHSADGRVAEN